VKTGKYTLTGSEWKNISKEGLDLVKKMLTYDPNLRPSAEECLNHSWIKKKVSETYDPKVTLGALNNLRHFRAEQKMQ
jgi:serine/threonine protein kinase